MKMIPTACAALAVAAAMTAAVPDPADAQVPIIGSYDEPYRGSGVNVWAHEPARPHEVTYTGNEPVGTILIDHKNRRLYFVNKQGAAIKYVISVGRQGMEITGDEFDVSRMQVRPSWTPTPRMRKEDPTLAATYAGGDDMPMGSRAIYLGTSEYRIHGTNEPHKLDKQVSSGCIRMHNRHVIHLYNLLKPLFDAKPRPVLKVKVYRDGLVPGISPSAGLKAPQPHFG